MCKRRVALYIPEYGFIPAAMSFPRIFWDSKGLSPKITAVLIHLQEVAYTSANVL